MDSYSILVIGTPLRAPTTTTVNHRVQYMHIHTVHAAPSSNTVLLQGFTFSCVWMGGDSVSHCFKTQYLLTVCIVRENLRSKCIGLSPPRKETLLHVTSARGILYVCTPWMTGLIRFSAVGRSICTYSIWLRQTFQLTQDEQWLAFFRLGWWATCCPGSGQPSSPLFSTWPSP